MSATYTSPDNSDSDWVRFKIGDTIVTGEDAVVSDEEIAAMLVEKGNKWPAAHAIALSITRRYQIFALKASNEDMMEIASAYRKTADEILREMSAEGFTPSLPSRSISAKDATLDDTDRISPRFSRGQHVMTGTSAFTREDDL